MSDTHGHNRQRIKMTCTGTHAVQWPRSNRTHARGGRRPWCSGTPIKGFGSAGFKQTGERKQDSNTCCTPSPTRRADSVEQALDCKQASPARQFASRVGQKGEEQGNSRAKSHWCGPARVELGRNQTKPHSRGLADDKSSRS